ncbi:MAG: type II secretion system ATPase GspE [Desulfobacteraceae bacterium]|jgi:general secretion pathway protein E|nr:type II secretion system ATPase GspE [Desulfobacteraceae bacterium]
MFKRLSHILFQEFDVSEEAFAEAQQISLDQNEILSETLIKKKIVSEQQLLEAFSRLYKIPFLPRVVLDEFNTDFTQQVSIQFLKKYAMVPIKNMSPMPGLSENEESSAKTDQSVILINDPSSFQPLDDVIKILGWDNVTLLLSTRESILSLINTAYDSSRDTAQQLVADMEESGYDIISEIEETADLLDDTSDAPIIKLVNHIISQSVKSGASDIHIEPYQNAFKVRNRVDGVLYDLLSPPKWMQSSLISRIKVMAKMNIAEKRLPQDGRFEVKIGDQSIDIRVSTIPITHGERLVLRLLNKSTKLFNLPELGIRDERLEIVEKLIQSSHGIILVTGPTGSGKSTTLYAILSKINSPDINIITIEDPVEYQLKGIGQIQVNSKIDLTFSRGLRSIVRQDPDVILIGEMRDQETADIGVQSALTGHLVFSTLHTNDSASAITRLIDIGVEPFLISSSVIAVIAQRLVRVLCNECKEPYQPDEETLKQLRQIKINEDLGQTDLPASDDTITIYRSVGCPKCFQSGYKGRIGIYEIMVLNESLQTMIMKTHDSHQIKKEAASHGMTSLYDDGIQKVLDGTTTIEEVLRVTQT